MIGVIYEVLSANVKRPAALLLTDPRVAADLVNIIEYNRLTFDPREHWNR